jgi:4-amino-4-deoxy-L-arabinose transferase-like glycosyltransferase
VREGAVEKLQVLGRTGPWLALAFYAVWGLARWVERDWRPEWDSAIYLLAGRSLAEGAGYTYLGEPFFLRPPGFSWLLSLALHDGSYDFHALNLAIMAFAAAAVAAVYLALRPRWGRWTALAVALLTGTCSLFVGRFNAILSDLPFAALLFAAVALLHRSAEAGGRWWVWSLGGALCVAAALYLRSVAVVLLPGLLLLGTRRGGRARWRRAVAPAVLVVMLGLPWWLHAREAASRAQRPAEQLLNFDYATAMLRTDPGDPSSASVSAAGWLERIRRNGSALSRDLAHVSLLSEAPWARLLAVGLLLAGWGLAVRRGPSLLEWLTLVYALVVLTYFTYHPRLVMPLAPLAYIYLLTAISGLARRAARRLGARWIPAAAGVAVFAVLFAGNLRALPVQLDAGRRPAQGDSLGQYWKDLRRIGDWLEQNTPEDAVILCAQAPVVSLLSGRRTYTFRFPRSPGLLDRHEVDYVVFHPGAPRALLRQVTDRSTRRWRLSSDLPRGRIAIHQLGGS